MVVSLVMMISAFTWLMYETKRLTIRLPFGKSRPVMMADAINGKMVAVIAFRIMASALKAVKETLDEAKK